MTIKKKEKIKIIDPTVKRWRFKEMVKISHIIYLTVEKQGITDQQ